MKNKKVIGSSQHGFMKGKSSLIDLTAFCNAVPSLADGVKQAMFTSASVRLLMLSPTTCS